MWQLTQDSGQLISSEICFAVSGLLKESREFLRVPGANREIVCQ